MTMTNADQAYDDLIEISARTIAVSNLTGRALPRRVHQLISEAADLRGAWDKYLALLLQRKGSYAEAADHWRRYLASDRVSEWAARARRSLKFCEIQVNLLRRRPDSPADSDRAA
jgi:hypothetical protein